MKLHLTSLAISLLLPIAAAAAPRERAPVGSVHQIGDHQLQVCFKHTPSAPRWRSSVASSPTRASVPRCTKPSATRASRLPKPRV